MKYLYILKIGTTFPSILNRFGDFDKWTISSLNPGSMPVRVVDIEHGSEPPPLEKCLGVVITGSHDMVTDNLPWSLRVEKWLPSLVRAEIPLLGICYGHQLLARAMGGEVGYHPSGIETGTVKLTLLSSCKEDPLFSSLPDNFLVHADHSQTVTSLPPGAVGLAYTGREANHAFRIGPNAWGLQFHPEFTSEIMRMYISEQAKNLHLAGLNVSDLLAGIRETSISRGIMEKFCLIAARTGDGASPEI